MHGPLPHHRLVPGLSHGLVGRDRGGVQAYPRHDDPIGLAIHLEDGPLLPLLRMTVGYHLHGVPPVDVPSLLLRGLGKLGLGLPPPLHQELRQLVPRRRRRHFSLQGCGLGRMCGVSPALAVISLVSRAAAVGGAGIVINWLCGCVAASCECCAY